ncbi:MAG: hypothetical protein F6J97_17880 [Leptolyngbya sp. SIO4C1]|nr:hypothetical protein [Leptolyngbya sp. SIO4C1]
MITHIPVHVLSILEVTALVTGLLLYGFLWVAANKKTGLLLFAMGHLAIAAAPILAAFYSQNPAKGGAVVAVVISFVIICSLLLLSLSQAFRQLVARVSPSWLIATHGLRIIPGIVILSLFEMGLLPATFALGAGYGDILAGTLALPTAWLMAAGSKQARPLALIWNSIGLLDLLYATGVGAAVVTPHTVDIAASGGPIGFLDWFLFLPTFPVSLWIASHLVLYWMIWPPARRRAVSG